MIIPDLNLVATLPLLFLSAWACVLLIVSLWIPKDRTHVSGWLTCLGLIVTIVLVLSSPEVSQEAFGGMLAVDGFSNLLHLLVAVFGEWSVSDVARPKLPKTA